MSYLVLARKWRPQTFEEIVGQEHVSTTLQNAIRADRVAHAFLFTGVRGVGKTTAARVLAKALNCEHGPTPTPCNTCKHCTEITAGSCVDVLEIDGASNTGVDDVREIIDNVRYRPAACRLKIYIIDEVHMLSTSAFNALLKTLEEPPAHVKFIFATTDPHKVPHTIHSRCQRYDFKRISYRQVVDRLALIAKADGIEVGERALFLIAREGEGSMRDAQSLFDQVIAYAGTQIADADVAAALGLADRERIYQLGAALAERDPSRAMALLNELHDYGYDLRRLTRELLEYFRNLSIAKLLPRSEILADLPDEEQAQLAKQAQSVQAEELDRAFRLLLDTEAEIARVPYPKLVLDMAVLKLATLAPVVPGDELLRRIDALAQGAPLPAASPARPPAASPASSPAAPPRTTSHARSRSAAPSTAKPAAAALPPVPNEPTSWSGFLQWVGKHRAPISPYLEASRPPDIHGDVLQLAVPPGYLFDYLNQRDNADGIAELASHYFARSLRIAVVAAEPEPAASVPAELDAATRHARAMEDPAVRAAVEILGGQLQEVRARKRPPRGDS